VSGAHRAVTTFRSSGRSRGRCSGEELARTEAIGVPHEEQKRASAATAAPQTGHAHSSASPQLEQKRASFSFGAPQWLQALTGRV
jgi:hypothetical protein